ncbi:MAG: thymidine phosphorylase [Wenzhouxiangellaceae bacterium]
MMLPAEIIRTKRDRHALSPEQIEAFVSGIVDGTVGDEQLGAFAMAVFLNGMTATETASLTLAMRDSGRVLSWGELPGPVLDKHSTGGVGDAVSLLLAPWLAACGAYVPMISGPGLGHTGGTLDKMRAIPGYDPFPSPGKLAEVVRDVGAAIIGQTDELAPADRRFYAVRDVTATVESVPLIVASILSKKMAAGLDGLVMDIKVGSGSVMGDAQRARALGAAIIEVSEVNGLAARALLTDMDQALATTAGNALEVAECIAIARGDAPGGRLLALTRELAIEMLCLGGVAESPDKAAHRLDRARSSGALADRLARMIAALGGPADLLEQADRYLPKADVVRAVHPDISGYVEAIDVRALGLCVVALGGGRRRAGDRIDPAVGLSHIAAIGDPVGPDPDRPLAWVHAADEAAADAAAGALRCAFAIAPDPVTAPALVRDRIAGRRIVTRSTHA